MSEIDRNALEAACSAYCDPEIPNNPRWEDTEENRIVLFNATSKYLVRISMERAIRAYLKWTRDSDAK